MKTKDRFVDIDNALKDLQDSIKKIEGVDTEEIANKVDMFRQDIYEGLSRWGSVELARHAQRPGFDDYVEEIFDSFMELHGDRIYEDDAAIRGGLAFLDGEPVVIIGHKKRSVNKKDYVNYNYGMASPSGHYKTIRLLRLAEKFSRPVVTFVDTPGANPVPDAEYKGQAFSIARCISTIAGIRSPVVSCIIGEAGSGGALALGFGDRIIMLENAFYSAITPEGYSSIVYGDDTRKERAADSLKGTGKDLYKVNIVDCLIKEPVGGAHNDKSQVIERTGTAIRKYIKELMSIDMDELMRQRAVSIDSLLPK